MVGHTRKVEEQFGRVANAYLSSTVHSQGADLLAVAEKLSATPNATVLDLGCGAGHLSFAVAPHVKSVIAYDLSSEMIEVVSHEAERLNLRNIVTRQGRAEEIPFDNASFDWVCTRYSAHHWMDIRQALREVRRILKPNGTLIVIDVCAPASPLLDTHLQAIELLRDASHVRDYAFAEWSSMLVEQELQVRTHRLWKLPLDFRTWVGRMQTPSVYVDAIRSLLEKAPHEVLHYFQIAEDGSFMPDAIYIEAKGESEE